MIRQARAHGGAGMRACSHNAPAGKSARKAQKPAVAIAASGIGMPPKLCRLTYTHDTPAPKRPRPKR
jgi:hypothetical protein